MPRGVVVFVGALAGAALVVTAAVAPLPAPGLAPVSWAALPLLAALLVAATWLMVPFRHGRSLDAVNLVEAMLAPLLIAFPPVVVVTVVAVSQIANGVLRRLPAVKTVFNTAMWTVAAGLGAGVVQRAGDGPVWPDQIMWLLAALAVVGVVNNLAFSTVMALAEPQSLRRLAARFLPVARFAWVGGWGVNAAFGLLFALAFVTSPWAVVVFPIPLLVGHLAYRSYSAARADHTRLADAHAAAARLVAPIEPMTVVAEFLAEVAECFDAARAELVLRIDGGGREIHRIERSTGRYTMDIEAEDSPSLEGAIAATTGVVAFTAADDEAISRTLAETGAASCLAAPLLHGDRLVGAILLLDRGGFAGSDEGEASILESLARETAGALAKGRLLADVLAERRKLGEIVDSASDGIFTLSHDGAVLTWNPALERITGVRREDVVGRRDVAISLRARTADGTPVDLAGRSRTELPADVFITVDGTTRHLTCSYSVGGADLDSAALVVVARDVTPAEEHEALREKVNRLVEVDAARRSVVEQLQQAVVPAPLSIADGEVAAAYEASDPSAPTGGDLYDWQVLPSGEVHIAVVDVLGHGVAATKDALAVVHTLRVVTAAGAPLGKVVAQADELLRGQHPDLVATVLVARYEPGTGWLRVASGGHPPALVVTPRREVRQINATGGVIGWPGAGSDDVAVTMLEPGDSLVLYTDGLVEARKNILDGIDALERHAAELAGLPAAQLADSLVERALEGAERRDDTLALVLRRNFVTARDDRASWVIAPDAAEANDLRRRLADWFRERGVDGDDALLAAAELLSNAVRAAATTVALHVVLAGDVVVLEVSDDGLADVDLARRGATLPDGAAERGRGLFLVREVSTHVDVLTTAEGTTIRAAVLAPQPKPAQPAGSADTALFAP